MACGLFLIGVTAVAVVVAIDVERSVRPSSWSGVLTEGPRLVSPTTGATYGVWFEDLGVFDEPSRVWTQIARIDDGGATKVAEGWWPRSVKDDRGVPLVEFVDGMVRIEFLSVWPSETRGIVTIVPDVADG